VNFATLLKDSQCLTILSSILVTRRQHTIKFSSALTRRPLAAGFASRKPVFHPRPVHVESLANKVALVQVFFLVLSLSPVIFFSINILISATVTVVQQGVHQPHQQSLVELLRFSLYQQRSNQNRNITINQTL